MIRGPRHPLLVEEVRSLVPESPGVYFFRGDGDEMLYIGKAINLRRRILGHLRMGKPGGAWEGMRGRGPDRMRDHAREGPRPDAPRHSRMVYEARSFEYQVTASELLALLLEDEMIKQHRPRFNVRQNEYLEYRYLELTRGEYPRLRICDHAGDFSDRTVFGPFRDRYLVEEILRLVHQSIGLRSCPDPIPENRCVEFELGRCAGPCADLTARRDYRRVVERSVAFLDGDVTEVARTLRLAMEQAAERLEFEKAQELKDRLGFCHRFGDRQRFFTSFMERRLIVEEAGPPSRTYVFVRGSLDSSSADLELAPDRRVLFDRASVVHAWLARNSSRCAHRFI